MYVYACMCVCMHACGACVCALCVCARVMSKSLKPYCWEALLAPGRDESLQLWLEGRVDPWWGPEPLAVVRDMGRSLV